MNKIVLHKYPVCALVLIAWLLATGAKAQPQPAAGLRALSSGPAPSASRDLRDPAYNNSLNESLQSLPNVALRGRLAKDLATIAIAAKTTPSSPRIDESTRSSFTEAKWRGLDALREAKTPVEVASVRQFLDAVDATEKAVYSASIRRNYPPDAYKAIFERSRAAVAIVRKKDNSPYCSAYRVKDNLILTARHCIAETDIKDIEVWEGYIRAIDGSVPAPQRHNIKGVIYTSDDDSIDFALISDDKPKSSSDSAGDQSTCISTDRVRLNDILYVLGYPQSGPLIVHDFGEVIFPYEATSVELDSIVVNERLRSGADSDAAIRSIKTSYAPATPGANTYFNFSSTWSGKPTIGVVADTFHGDSGSAVFSRETHRIIGVFVRGQPDYADAWSPSWKRHEAVLPIVKVLEHLRTKRPGLIESTGLCVL
ncbi:hypothetical protein D9M68_100500 [compost metagenome]